MGWVVSGKGCQEGPWGIGDVYFSLWLLVSHRLHSLGKILSSYKLNWYILVLNIYKMKKNQAGRASETLYQESAQSRARYTRDQIGFF